MRINFVRRFEEDSATTVDCAVDVAREGDYWVVCASCPPSDHPHNCAKSKDLASAVRLVIPCLKDYTAVIGRLEALARVRICEQWRGWA